MDKQSEHLFDDITAAIHRYSNTLFKICLCMLCKEQDAEDALQETFLRYISKAPKIQDDEHQKAWLIRTAINICKDMRRFQFRHTHINIDDLKDYWRTEESSGILEAILLLPQAYKIAIHLHYIEGYDIRSITEITGVSEAATKKRLQRGREMLRVELRKELDLNESQTVKGNL